MFPGTMRKLMVMLAVIKLGHSGVNGITVDPPAHLQIHDPGRLGWLNVIWTLPQNLINRPSCFVRFQLRYFCTYENRWRTVRTVQMNYSAQFDLEKKVHVRVQTLLSGPCSNGSTEMHSRYIEAVLPARREGMAHSRVDGLQCVFHSRRYLECLWQKEKKLSDSRYELYYWHKGMERSEACPLYVRVNGERTGCALSGDALMEYTEFNVCVNGSSAGSPLQAAYFTMEIQNYVKTVAPQTLSFESVSDGRVRLVWNISEDRIPDRCLEFEVESVPSCTEGLEETQSTRESSVLVSREERCRRACVRVRGRVHHYCADSSMWSDWSSSLCLADTHTSVRLWTVSLGLCVLFVMAVILFLTRLRCAKTSAGDKRCQRGIMYTEYQDDKQLVIDS